MVHALLTLVFKHLALKGAKKLSINVNKVYILGMSTSYRLGLALYSGQKNWGGLT